MMRLKKLWITMILIACSLLCFAACKEDRVAQSISLNGYSAETPLEFKMGAGSFNGYTVTVTYDNGDTEEVALTEDMISETDKLKFYHEGESEISITYQGISVPVAIKVSRNVFPDSVQLNDFTKEYDGKVYTVEVEGEIPGGTKILYPQGKTFQNAGSYDMTAILQCDGYVTKTLTAKVVIEKATYDLSSVRLSDKTVVYNKDAQSIALQGELPAGVSVSYTITQIQDGKGEVISESKRETLSGNQAINAGKYLVCAQFQGDAGNYNRIPDVVGYLTITRAEYNLSKVKFTDKTVMYTGQKYSLSLSEDSAMPSDVEVAYAIKLIEDSKGNKVIANYQKGNEAVNAGVYMVEASFTITGKNAENYTTSLATKTAKLIIQPASYDAIINAIYLNSQCYEWTADATYRIAFEAELPTGVSPQFVIKNAKGEVIKGTMEIITKTEGEGDNAVVKTIYQYSFTAEEVGEYACVVTFKHDNLNYADITVVLEAWVILTTETELALG